MFPWNILCYFGQLDANNLSKQYHEIKWNDQVCNPSIELLSDKISGTKYELKKKLCESLEVQFFKDCFLDYFVGNLNLCKLPWIFTCIWKQILTNFVRIQTLRIFNFYGFL